MKFFTRKYRILHVCLLVIILLAGLKAIQVVAAIKAGAEQGPPPATVNTTVVKSDNWPETVSAVGTLIARQGARLSFEANGRVAAINFEADQRVEAGAVLISLDTAVEQAELEAAEARLKLAGITRERQAKLRDQKANSVADLDLAQADLRLAQAEVSRIESLIKRRQVIAPFSGVVGIKKVNVGDFIVLSNEAVDLNDNSEFYLEFNLPQNMVSSYKTGDRVTVSVDDGKESNEFDGVLTGINSQVDPLTRNVLMQAAIKNRDDLLKAGMFVSLELIRDQAKEVLIVPTNSIIYTPYGNTAYEIIRAAKEPPFSAQAHTVKLGRIKGDFIEVVSGLKEGQEIVASGLTKIFPGVNIFVDNSVLAVAEIDPAIENK